MKGHEPFHFALHGDRPCGKRTLSGGNARRSSGRDSCSGTGGASLKRGPDRQAGWQDLKQNDSARDLWSQLLEQLSKDQYATLQDPDYNPVSDMEMFRAEMRRSGWSDEHIALRVEAHEAQVERAPSTSPGVNPHAEFMFGRLCDDVEAAMDRLGLSSQTRVAHGLEPRLGPYAAQTNVIMTEESIITVGTQLCRFCGLVARAFTRTLQMDAEFWDSDRYSQAAATRLIRTRPDVMLYWTVIYTSYALTGMHVLVPFRPASVFELSFEHVARAMELFAVAHEYGHHQHRHGREIDPQAARAEEFEADQFALKVCYEVDRYPELGPNPYLTSGAGGLILLRALAALRTVETRLNGAQAGNAGSHPEARERAERFDTVALLRPGEFAALQHFRRVSARIMDTVDAELAQWLGGLTAPMIRSLEPLRALPHNPI